MDWGALLLGIVALLAAILDERRRTAPARARHALETDYDDAVRRATAALSRGDADALARLFETERQAALRRGDLDPRGPGAELRPDPGAADRGPGDRAAG